MKWQRWHAPQRRLIPPTLRAWLTDTGSLTQRLQSVSQRGFSVQVIVSGWQLPSLDEARQLKCDPRQWVFCREVILLEGNAPRVFARTVVPLVSYPPLKQQLSALGSGSLGALLFSDPTVQRGPLEVSYLTSSDLLHEHAQAATDKIFTVLWARRSCFKLKQQALLVSEVFLPGDHTCPWYIPK